MAHPQIILFGLDGAEPDLLFQWASEGKLPTMGHLIRQGTGATLESVATIHSASAWTSFATGVNPGKHGLFFFLQRVPGTYEMSYVNASHCPRQTFWELLSEAGLRVAVVNVPLTYPVRPVNGLQVAGWPVPDSRSPGFAYPPSLVEELYGKYGTIPVTPSVSPRLVRRKPAVAWQQALEAMRIKHQIAEDLFQREEWDLFITATEETDFISHYYWHWMDPEHPEHQAVAPQELKESILTCYQEAERHLERLLEAARRPVTVLIISDHGFTTFSRGGLCLGPFLENLGLQKSARALVANPRAMMTWGRGWLGRMIRGAIKPLFAAETIFKLAERFPSFARHVASQSRLGGIDYRNSRAFATGIHNTSDIWLNVRGREPWGVVDGGEEYQELCAILQRCLLSARSIATGEPAVERVVLRNEAFPGPYAIQAPDLLVHWKQGIVLSGIEHVSLDGENTLTTMVPSGYDEMTGSHALQGVLVASGENIRRDARIENAGIMDLAPTVLYLFGQPIPEDWDGRVLRETIVPSFLEAHPRQRTEAAAPAGPTESYEYSKQEQCLVEERLRNLGYLE